jgi:hypothetical protein
LPFVAFLATIELKPLNGQENKRTKIQKHKMINFRSKIQLKLLRYYFEHPDEKHYVRELARTLSFNGTHLSRELATFARKGFFISEMQGKEKYFYLNQHYPLYKEIKKLVFYL